MKIFVYPLLDICECNTSQGEAHERKVEKTYSMLSALQDPGQGATPTWHLTVFMSEGRETHRKRNNVNFPTLRENLFMYF